MKAIITALLITLSLGAISGCDRPRSRAEVKQGDYTTGRITENGCDFIVFKEAHGDIYRTVGIVHDPKCKKCK